MSLMQNYSTGDHPINHVMALQLITDNGTFNGTNNATEGNSTYTDDMIFNSGHKLNIICYSILFIFSSIGNLTILFVLIQRRRKSPSRIDAMLMHLAIADLLVAFLMMPMEIGWAATVQWVAGDFMCRLSMFNRTFGLYLSSNILMCISIDRYLAVIKPLNNYGIDTRSKLMIGTSWIAAIICSIPQAIIFRVRNHPEHPEFVQCVTFEFFDNDNHIMIYSLLNQVVMFYVPLVVIVFCYASIYHEIFEKSQMGNDKGLRRSSIQVLGRAKRRTLKMTIVIVIVFLVCWTPYAVIVTYYAIDGAQAQKLHPLLQKALFLFACTNSCLNPIVYGIYNIRKRSNTCKHIGLMHSSAKRSQEFIKSDSRRTMISEIKETI